MQFDDVIAVGEHLLIGHRLDRDLLFGLGLPVGIKRVRQGEDLLVVRLIALVGYDRSAFRYESTEATRMIKMIMGVNYILDGFIGNHPLGFGNDRAGALLALRPLDYDDVV